MPNDDFIMTLSNTKSQDLKADFSKKLRETLKKNYGKIPSASLLAREFNLRAINTSPITQESARRWMRGTCMPEDQRLKILASWLSLDLNAIFCSKNDDSSSTITNLLNNLNPKQLHFLIKLNDLLIEYGK